MRFSPTEQKELVSQIRREFLAFHRSKLLPFGGGPAEKYCLYWAFFTTKVLRKAGCKEAQIQAGTAYWPIVTPEQDDGVSANQYGYKFEWTRTAWRAVSMGIQPEMHCWVAIAKPPAEIIDVTAPFFKKRALEEGYNWKGVEPPDFLWHEATDLPQGVVYWADEQAIELSYAFLDSAINGRPLVIRQLRPLEG